MRDSKPEVRPEARIRQHISAEAARIMSDEGVRDFHTAKRKAADRLNLPNGKNLPNNQEVEAALHNYLRLFHKKRLAAAQQQLRSLALEALHFFVAFEPRLAGSVLSGIVTPESTVQVHVCADTPEEIGLILQEHNIPYEETDRRVRYGGDRADTCPVYRFSADSIVIEVYVFNPQNFREPPLSPVNGQPMRRATVKEVEGLLNQSDLAPRNAGQFT